MSATLATEDILIIETPERVPLHFALASIGNRFLACAIDHAIQALSLALIAGGFLIVANSFDFEDAFSTAPKWVIAVMILALFLILTGYFAFFEWMWSGQTPGKRWLKLRVIREDGRPITFWESSIRNLLRAFDMMPGMFYSIGLISVFATTRDQRIGDMVAGTVVVREREAEAPAFAQVFASPVSDPALRRSFKPVDFQGSLTSLTEAEIQLLKRFSAGVGICLMCHGNGWPGGFPYRSSTRFVLLTTWQRLLMRGFSKSFCIDIYKSIVFGPTDPASTPFALGTLH
jgi:uncharacterized RDD family membrane protein YckC